MSEDTSVPPRYILLIPLGFIIWSVGFIALYATNAVGCAFGWDPMIQRVVLVALGLGFVGINGGVAWWIWRLWRTARHAIAPAPSLTYVGIFCASSAFVAMIGVAVPGLATTMCM